MRRINNLLYKVTQKKVRFVSHSSVEKNEA